MGLLARAFTRRNLFAIAAGVFLVGAPLIAFDFWLGGVIDRQGQAEADASAKRAIALAESRTTAVIAALDDLAGRGIDSCEPAHIEAMRTALFQTIPVKEVSIVGPGGQTICTDSGLQEGPATPSTPFTLRTAHKWCVSVASSVMARMKSPRLFRRAFSFRM